MGQVAQEAGLAPKLIRFWLARWRSEARGSEIRPQMARKQLSATGFPAIQIPRSRSEKMSDIEHDYDDARIDDALHRQADRVQASRVRLERILFSDIQRDVHGEGIHCEDQRHDADVDEGAGKSRERVLFDIDHERDEQEIAQHGNENDERRDEIEKPAALQDGGPLPLRRLVLLVEPDY